MNDSIDVILDYIELILFVSDFFVRTYLIIYYRVLSFVFAERLH